MNELTLGFGNGWYAVLENLTCGTWNVSEDDIETVVLECTFHIQYNRYNFAVECYLLDEDNHDTYSNFEQIDNFKYIEGDQFLDIAEQLGTIYSLGAFMDNINNQDMDNFSNCYVRAFLVNCDEPEEVVELDDFNTLYVCCGEIKQR